MNKPFRNRFSSLRAKLLKSHSLVALFGVLLLVISIVSSLWLKENVVVWQKKSVPMVQLTENLQSNLQMSLAALRGWVNVNDPLFKQERDRAWQQGIWPDLDKLLALAKETKDQLLEAELEKLKVTLANLQMWQWRIEDVAQAPGNHPARVFMTQYIDPSAQQVLSYVTFFLDKAKLTSSTHNAELIHQLAAFQSHFTQSFVRLSRYILTGQDEQLKTSNLMLVRAQEALSKYSQPQLIHGSDALRFNEMRSQFKAFIKLRYHLVTLKETYNQSLAGTWLQGDAAPLARLSDKLLASLISMETAQQDLQANQVLNLVDILTYGMLFFIVILLVISFWIATIKAKRILQPIDKLLLATKKLAAGKQEELLEVSSNDEVGELTKAFNNMLHLRQLAEEKMRQTVETAVDPIITINDKGIVQTINTATTRLLGYTALDMVGNNIAMIMPEPHSSNHDGYLANYIKTRNKKIIGRSREVEARTKTGELIPVTLSVSEILVGNERQFTGILHDIRKERSQFEKMQSLNQRLENQAQLQDINSELEDSLRGLDEAKLFAEAVLKFFARRFEMVLSMFFLVDSKEETITLLAGYGFKDRRKRATQFKWGEGLVGEAVRSRQMISLTSPDEDYFKVSSGVGAALPNQIVIYPLLFENEVIGAIELCSIAEIDERVIQHIQSLIKKVGVNLKVALAKQQLQKLLAESEMQKSNLRQQEEELRSSNEELESQAQALKQSEEELRSTNEELHAQVSLIENQKEELTRKTEEVSKSSQYKTEFLANMSHELRTPLNSLLILAQSFMNNKAGNLTKEQEEEARIIYEAGTDLLTLINDILDISKVEAGKLSIEVAAVSIQDVVASVLKQFKAVAAEKEIRLVIDYDEKNLVDEIWTDQLRLMQILKNLLSNALKFTQEGSVTLRISQQQSDILFEVIDTGIGIPKDKQDLVFAEFQQADGSTSRQYGGTGLGLSISRKLAKLMQGGLELMSEEGKGSTFTLKLPVVLRERAKAEVQASDEVAVAGDVIRLPADIASIEQQLKDDRSHYDQQKPGLLIIDDDEKFLQAMVKLIRGSGFQILLALTGEVGMQLAAAYQPQGVVLDLGLPDINGEEVLKTLKGDSRTASIPVHVISARDKSNDTLSLGALSFLQKPVRQEDVDSLLEMVSQSAVDKLLIVEDDKVTQKGLVDVFSELSKAVEIDFAETAAKAKEKLRSTSYSCVVVDLGLPDESGVSLIESLVDEMKLFVPIIVYTARELTDEEYKKIKKYTSKVVIKGIEATERLLDEVQLFLHHLEEDANFSSNSVSAASVVKQGFEGQHVLLVDDDLRNTFALSRALEAEGLSVTIADNGQLAIEKLQQENNIALVLMDMMMPIMDGYEAIKTIRGMDEFKSLPIIALTAKATQQDREQCIEAGANDYMSKPINVEALLELLSIWLVGSGGRRA